MLDTRTSEKGAKSTRNIHSQYLARKKRNKCRNAISAASNFDAIQEVRWNDGILTSASSPSSVQPNGKDEEQNPKDSSKSSDEPWLLEQLLNLSRDPVAILLGQISEKERRNSITFNSCCCWLLFCCCCCCLSSSLFVVVVVFV